jgi:hypothetical protein
VFSSLLLSEGNGKSPTHELRHIVNINNSDKIFFILVFDNYIVWNSTKINLKALILEEEKERCANQRSFYEAKLYGMFLLAKHFIKDI